MKRRLMIFFAVLAVIFGLLTWRGRVRAQAEADLWAAATDEF